MQKNHAVYTPCFDLLFVWVFFLAIFFLHAADEHEYNKQKEI